MTVPQQTPVSNCWGNNSATEFSFNFYIAKESELLVEHTDLNGIKSTLENGVDYSIHQVGNTEGSYITFPLTGSKYKTLAWDTSTDKKELLTLSLTLPIQQIAEYKDSGDLSKHNLELSFDYAIRLIQILDRTISRAVKVSEGDKVTPDQLIESLNESKRIAVDAANSAKSQAEYAQNSANVAKDKADIATAKTAEVTETYNNAMADIQADWQSAISNIEDTHQRELNEFKAEAEIERAKIIETIISTKASSVEAVDNAKTNAINEITTKGTEQKNLLDEQVSIATEQANISTTKAANALLSEQNAKLSESNALIWAEGSDQQVQAIGGQHSAKGWASIIGEQTNIINVIYPIGSLYMSVNDTSPDILFGVGTWEKIKDTFLLASGDTYNNGATGGEVEHILSESELPTHAHTATSNNVGAHTHSRGSMNISGNFLGNEWEADNITCTGAFTSSASKMKDGASGTDRRRIVTFTASRNWTGATSSNGAHAHTITVNSTGANAAHNNMPPYLAVNIWKRIA